MPVEFLADEEAAVFGCYAGPPTRAELDRMFYLDDEDLRLIAKRRGDRGFTATAVDWQGTEIGYGGGDTLAGPAAHPPQAGPRWPRRPGPIEPMGGDQRPLQR
jgi:hypothetical protein